jgi:hypothetical protein
MIGAPMEKTRLLDRKRHQETDAAAAFVIVADQRQADDTVFQARHGRREETAGEEDVRLHGAVGEEIEFGLQFIALTRGIKAKLAAGAADGNGVVGNGLVRHRLRKAPEDTGRPAVGVVWKMRIAGHGRGASALMVRGSAKAKRTMPKVRRTAT